MCEPSVKGVTLTFPRILEALRIEWRSTRRFGLLPKQKNQNVINNSFTQVGTEPTTDISLKEL